MKKIALIVVCILMLGILSGCASSSANSDTASAPAQAAEQPKVTEDFLYKTSNLDYTLYMNIYYNDMASTYVGTKMNTVGTFTTINDRFNGRTRYYVWGYLDETKCCDWQWELVLPEGYDIPANGSLVKVSGIFTQDANALDNYWWTDVTMTVQTAHAPSTVDVDMSMMNATLERVQLLNMQYFPAEFEGKTVCLYGRVETPTSIQHPYYDGAWSQEVTVKGTMPQQGSTVLVNGVFAGGVVTEAEAAKTDRYY